MFDLQSPIIVVILTYGNRKKYLQHIIQSLAVKQVHDILLVANEVNYDIRKFVASIESEKEITIIENPSNLGSAGGYASALQQIRDNSKFDKSFVLLMDDDNFIDAQVFQKLSYFEKKTDFITNHVWSFYRSNISNAEMFAKPTEYNSKFYNNSINRFSIWHHFHFMVRHNEIHRKYPSVNRLIFAPYSGLFFPTVLLKKVGLPDRRYFLYEDDNDFSLRICRAGYEILQNPQLKIYDQEDAWYAPTNLKKKDRSVFFQTPQLFRPLYMYRNSMFLSKKLLVTNSVLFRINVGILILRMFFQYMPKNKEGIYRFRLFCRALADGDHGQMGKSPWIERERTKA
ncbi:putative Glycosyltransferase, group 2 family protein [Oenococcus oeni]|uniref:glycosyltransferase family 2 protein n=1 Tax=Oenococcus oeni TaxID=1247 RepID=UPI0010B6B4F7|nr:glycosyltransferase [Oenococcus oeni]SYW12247.1 putative Glycosyltransferase, group 2 family protein [Oenococcus oeni]